MANPFPFSVGAVLTAAQMNSIGEAAISYTPTVSTLTGSLTSVTSAAKYMRVNKLCVVQFNITITTNGTGAGILYISLPFNGINSYGNTAIGVARETSATGFLQQIFHGSTNLAGILNYDNSYPGANNRNFTGTIIYEVA